jgi:hypothetical protein
MVICFGPLGLIVIIGLVVSPSLLLLLLNGETAGILAMSLLIGGSLGLWSVRALVLKILKPDVLVMPVDKIRYFMFGGFLALFLLLGLGADSGLTWSLSVLLLPALASIHLMYMARGYVFSS